MSHSPLPIAPSKTDNPPFRWRDVPRAIWYFLEDEKLKCSVAFVLLFFIFFFELVPAFIAGKIVDFFGQYHAGDSLKTFYLYLLILGVTIPLAAFIRLESRKVLQFAGFRMRARARIWGFERLTEMSMQWHAQENSGNKIQRIFTGSLALKDWMRLIGGDLLSVGAYTVGIVGIFFIANIKIALFILLYILTFVIVEVIYNKKMMLISDQFNVMDQKAGGIYIEGSGNIMALKASGSANAMTSKVKNTEERAQELGILKSKTGFAKWQIFRIVDGPAIAIFFLLIGQEVIAGTISTGMILVFFSYFVKLYTDVRARMSDIDESIIDLKSGLGNMMPIFWEQTHVPTGKEKFPVDWKEIAIKQGTLAYPSGQIGLDKLDLMIRRGEKLGIAGSSGGGKSTLVKLILGLYSLREGNFEVGGRNYYDISHDDMIHHISVVLQETELFNISLRENITMMREEEGELLQKAIEISQLSEVISHLPDGVDTLIGERGYMLSGGERQRLGIARAIYKNSEIMILDEATSSLDSETERKIMERLLGEYGHGKTMVIVAHRLSTLASTDRVAVIENGMIVEEGTYRDLLANDASILSKLSKTQVTPSASPLQ